MYFTVPVGRPFGRENRIIISKAPAERPYGKNNPNGILLPFDPFLFFLSSAKKFILKLLAAKLYFPSYKL